MTTEEKLAKFKVQAIKQLTDSGVTKIDEDKLDVLVNNLKTVINNKDAVLVSGIDPSELDTVRRNFVVKKLNIDDKEVAMKAIRATASDMSGIRQKNRAAFYYIVQEKLT